MSDRWLRRIVVAFLVMFLTNGATAAIVIGPLLQHRYADVVATTVQPGLLIAGYLLIAVAVTVVHDMAAVGADRRRALQLGASLGLAIFAGSHLVQAGYTTMDPVGWILSGVADAAGPTLAVVALSVHAGRTRASSRA